MISYGKLLNNDVKAIAKDAGWTNCWFVYNDKVKNGRRLSYCGNGWRVPEEMKKDILVKVKSLVKKHNITAEVFWHVAHRWGYGDYDKLVIRINEVA